MQQAAQDVSSHDVVAVAGEFEVVVVGIASVQVAYAPVYMALDTVLEAWCLTSKLALGALVVLYVPIEVYAFPGKHPAHLIHSFHVHDRRSPDFVLVEEAEILTWAERGMPLNEQCRTPLWPNSDRERTAPGLIFLDVRRGRYTKYRDEMLRIAWK